ncbi:hypothetical protein [Pseudomonas sp. Tri1]|uniref:hypothetical protein n=1 Tax=Pseudomonas sp. Tri1 TaxID=2823875 RepID=UPI001B32E584|nr:hypothetical protein [Pseudomonas sp. Tri1]
MSKKEDKPAQIFFDYKNVIETLSRVEEAFAVRRLKCHSGSALGSLFSSIRRIAQKSENLNKRQWHISFIKSTEAIRILNAVEAVLDEIGAQEAIHRITTSDMNLGTRQESNGKDALWELDLYRRFKLGGVSVSFEEPDLVVSLGESYGEYAIACKKIYSRASVQESFKGGCNQLKTHGKPGVIAFNLDDVLPRGPLFEFSTATELKQRIDMFNTKFIRENERHFARIASRGACDGVLVSTSFIAHVPDMNPPVNVIRTSAAWTSRKEPNVQDRFNAFIECHDRIYENARV